MLYFLLTPIIYVEEGNKNSHSVTSLEASCLFLSFPHRQTIMLGKCGVEKTLSTS